MGGGGKSAQVYTVSQAATLPVCLCHRKVAPIKLIENPSPLIHPNSKQGRERKKTALMHSSVTWKPSHVPFISM